MESKITPTDCPPGAYTGRKVLIMAYIKSISFMTTDREHGCRCDKCGQWIKNVWTVKFTDEVIMNFGIDCYEKLYKSGKLTKTGEKVMKDALKGIELWSKLREEWENMTETDARERELLAELDPNSYCNKYVKSYWCDRTFEEYKDWILNELIPERLDEAQKKIDRFSKVNFDR